MNAYLLVISDREALGWILTTKHMAFSDPLRAEARQLAVGDILVLYTTRGCFKNPTRDRGRIIGEATVSHGIRRSEPPPNFGVRTFPYVCDVRIRTLTALGAGPELAAHAGELHALGASGARLGTLAAPALVPLDADDLAHLRDLADYPRQRPTTGLIAPYARWTPNG